MRPAEGVIVALARTLPGLVRERYREEWLADLAGARGLKASPWSVVHGAAAIALTIDRTDPRVTGIPRTRLIAYRMRWAAAFLGSALLLGVGNFLRGGYDAFPPVGVILHVLAFVFAAVGLFAGVGALTVALAVGGKRTALVLGIGVMAVVAAMVGAIVLPLFGMLGVPILVAFLVIVAAGGKGERSDPRALQTSRRILLALPFTLLALAIVAAGILHIVVWNPLAKVPGLTLDEIYTAMAAADETPIVAFVVIWAIFWGTAAMVLPILSGLPRLASFLTARRIVVTGLLVVGVSASFSFFAGFNMGMSLADTFMTNGGGAARSGPAIALVGQLAVIAALVIGLVPRRPTGHLSRLGGMGS